MLPGRRSKSRDTRRSNSSPSRRFSGLFRVYLGIIQDLAFRVEGEPWQLLSIPTSFGFIRGASSDCSGFRVRFA